MSGDEKGEINQDMVHYLTEVLEIQASAKVIKETVKALGDNQVGNPAELTVVPEEEFKNIFPWQSHKKHHVVVMQARKMTLMWEQQNNQPTSSSSDMATATQQLADELKKPSKEGKSNDSDSEADLKQPFDCEKCLTDYHFPNFPIRHLPKMDKVERLLKRQSPR